MITMPRAAVKHTLPMITMKGLVVFPGMVLNFDVTRPKFIEAVKTACLTDKRIFLVTQNDFDIEDPHRADLFDVGVVAEIRQILKTPDKVTRVLVQGLFRAKLSHMSEFESYNSAIVTELPEKPFDMEEKLSYAYERTLKMLFSDYMSYVPKIPSDLSNLITAEHDLKRLFDLIVFNIFLKTESKQTLLEINEPEKRIKTLIEMLTEEIKILKFEAEINEQIRDTIDNNQREYILREQMRAISKQLSGEGDIDDEVFDYSDRIQAIGFPEETEEKLLREVNKMYKVSQSSQEYGLLKTYLDSVLEVPWNVFTTDTVNIEKAEKQLEKDHYGLKKVKERILEIISVRKLNPDVKSQIICLVGPPGVGKTSVGKSIAAALGRHYVRVSLGGVRDEAEIRGHRKTYVGAMPGRIVNALKQAKCMNPVILFDEIDKMGNDYKGDPASAMLEVLDPEQNSTFTDHYLEIPTDLSDVLFITTANTTDTIPAPLLDRMEIIELSSYTREEKFNIAKKHLLPKQLKKHGETRRTLKINDKALYAIIDGYTKEAGVRGLEKKIAAVCRKAAKKLVSGETVVTVNDTNLKDYLGTRKYLPETISKTDETGIVTGLAWTSVGGVTMPLEVIVMEGDGKVEVTGSLGDVMKESSKIAVSLVRSIADKYSIDPEFYKKKDLHIHAPEGAVPKDGPSAGVTMTTALVSALSGMPVKRDIAMTGEITLHGKVLPIGGLKEKSMAAYKAGVKTVIIPKENEADLDEVDETVKDNVRFIPAEKIQTVLENALVFPQGKKAGKAPAKRGRTAGSKASHAKAEGSVSARLTKS
ncbi:MAG: endopeptidase La [Ruminiclostridium sp.]|nr:endopeptidase La [Ruminiclostridium sp.]